MEFSGYSGKRHSDYYGTNRLNKLLKGAQNQTNWTDYTVRKRIRLTGLVLQDRDDGWTGSSGKNDNWTSESPPLLSAFAS